MPEFNTIGKYEILEVIGEGGFGIVYKARDPLMERFVAIKVCSTEDDHIRKRFLREARIAGGLDHPNIVTAFDSGTEQGVPFLVQELLTGEDLRTKIDRRDPIEPAVKVDYLVQIAKALSHAHEHGVLHRDIKPANVRVLDDGRVKVMDFGMAKIGKDTATRLTQAGAVMGTAGYFAPEQLMALDLDQRVDIFSFGVLAYELLTSEKAFPGDSFMVVFRKVLHDEPVPLETLWPECPAELARLVETCLRKERDERFSSFSEVLPPLFSVLSQSFDRRSESRSRPESDDLGASVDSPDAEISTSPIDRTMIVKSPRKEAPPTIASDETLEPSDERASSSVASHASGRPQPSPIESDESPEVETQGRATSDPVLPLAKEAPQSSTSKKGVKNFGAFLRSVDKRIWIPGGAIALSLLLVGSWLARRPDTDKEIAEETVTSLADAPTDSDPSTSPIPTYGVFVEATPWGEIVALEDSSGNALALPNGPFTPVLLQLPEGAYTIRIKDPHTESVQDCPVTVSRGTDSSCLILFPTLDSVEYFKEAGWWD